MIEIDGAEGEGGGQIIRTALALSMVTREPFRMRNVRAARDRPGLRPQHLVAVQAAATVSKAEAHGAVLGSTELVFVPRALTAGEYRFDIGTAGSTTLVLQTLAPALAFAGEPSTLVIDGGTHNDKAPPFDFLAQAFAPVIRRMGWSLSLELHRHGFYPRGGGRVSATVMPLAAPVPLELLARGPIAACVARALVARLPRHIGVREVNTVRESFSLPIQRAAVEEVGGVGPGNAVLLEIAAESITEVISAIGRKGLPAELVAAEAIRQAEDYLRLGAPVGPHLADQLLLPMALAAGGRFRTSHPSLHAVTNAKVIRKFLACSIEMTEIVSHQWEVNVTPRA
ncbi:MAG: RNA 3'-terminal phosphate cyclase [Candidatus Schekmanbacteria bacterium]|nr:RNA 3'-terminal phosphate cyclase [Candidatus Schekmanbacteria bacterium]